MKFSPVFDHCETRCLCADGDDFVGPPDVPPATLISGGAHPIMDPPVSMDTDRPDPDGTPGPVPYAEMISPISTTILDGVGSVGGMGLYIIYDQQAQDLLNNTKDRLDAVDPPEVF